METMQTLQPTDFGVQSIATQHFGVDAQVIGMTPDNKGFVVDRGGGKMVTMPVNMVRGALVGQHELELQHQSQGGSDEGTVIATIIKD